MHEGCNIHIQNFAHTTRRKLDSFIKKCKGDPTNIIIHLADKRNLFIMLNSNDYIKVGTFYTLPKLHKLPTHPFS